VGSSTSDTNVELVREAIAAFLRGDFDAARPVIHPDVVCHRAAPLPDPQTYHGQEGVLQMYADWTRDFDEFEMSTGEFIGAGDRVVVEFFQRGRGRTSGAVVEGQFWFVYTVADGLITRQDVFNNRAQAFGSAGLDP
jgi:ketosteroid isomerase-like protein